MFGIRNFFSAILYRLQCIENGQTLIIRENQINWEKTMSALDDLNDEVTNNTNVTKSVIALLGALKKDLDDAIASGDMDRVKAIRDQLAQNDSDIAAAIVVNTPAADMTTPLPSGNATGPSNPQNPTGAIKETQPGSASAVTPATQHPGVLNNPQYAGQVAAANVPVQDANTNGPGTAK